jgi:hypothetical protein
MIKNISAAMIVGLLLALTFIGIALYLLIFPESVGSASSRQDLLLYALLTGAYGIWRLVRVWLAWKDAEESD